MTTHRDRVRAEFTPEDWQRYRAYHNTDNALDDAKIELATARRKVADAKRAAKAAKDAFDQSPAGSRFWRAVHADCDADYAKRLDAADDATFGRHTCPATSAA